ncbi:MAG: phospholipase, partial [Ktedonobacteraceae bacterium]
MKQRLLSTCLILLALGISVFSATAASATTTQSLRSQEEGGQTTTPIKHLVVIFDENISFDHYFG